MTSVFDLSRSPSSLGWSVSELAIYFDLRGRILAERVYPVLLLAILDTTFSYGLLAELARPPILTGLLSPSASDPSKSELFANSFISFIPTFASVFSVCGSYRLSESSLFCSSESLLGSSSDFASSSSDFLLGVFLAWFSYIYS